MKNIKFKTNESINLRVIQCSLIGSILLTSSCSMMNSETCTDTQSAVSTTETTTVSSSVETTPVEYNLNWTDADTDEFAKYYEQEIGGDLLLSQYIKKFGFTDELSQLFTKFVNTKYGTEYTYVPFSEPSVNYFYNYTVGKEKSFMYHNNYDLFCQNFVSDDALYHSAFYNKLIYSYLIQNNIPFGTRISIENFRALMGDDLLNDHGETKYIMRNKELLNYPSSYKYSEFELYIMCVCYNDGLTSLCNDERNVTWDFFTTDEKYAEKAQKCMEIYNGYLKQKFGENAVQFGKVPTRDQYIAMFGEEPLDLSYIPGAVVQETPVKGDAKVRVDYNSSYDNYDVYYTEPYYGDESSGRGRRM